MATNKNLAQIERDTANISTNLLNIAIIFAQIDQRLADMEAKLERLLVEPPAKKIETGTDPNARARGEQLIALLDQRIEAALKREQQLQLEAMAGVARDVLSEFMGEVRQLQKIIESKLTQPFDPTAHERPN